MDVDAYSWACGSSIRALSQATPAAEGLRPAAHGLLSVWATAVHAAAAEGEVDDLEGELGPAAGLPVGELPVVELPVVEEEIEVEPSPEVEVSTTESNAEGCLEGLQEDQDEPIKAVSEDTKDIVRKELREKKDVDFLAVLSAWSDEKVATRLLEESRLLPSTGPSKQKSAMQNLGPKVPVHRGPVSKDFLESLKVRFPKTEDPPAESKRWTRQDFHLYFATAGTLRPRRDRRPFTEEEIAQEMQQTSRASPLLAELRMQLAADKVTKAPTSYASLFRHLLAIGNPSQLPVAEVQVVPRVARATELKTPICVQKQRGWKMRSWGMAFWSYECGETVCDCFRHYPPSSHEASQLPVKARVDELGKYINILQDMDPQCIEEQYLAYPRFLASWSPFESIPKARRLFEQDLDARRKLWNPPGLKDLSAKWFDQCCLALGLNLVPELSQQDSLHFGPPGILTQLHVENSSAHVWHAQIQGRRMFVMFAPQDTERLHGKQHEEPIPSRFIREWMSPVDIFSPKSKHKESFSECRAHVVILEPGEVLVVPAGWWQCSLALEAFTTLSRRFWDRSNRLGVLDEMARLSDLRDSGPQQRMRLKSQLPILREQIQEDDLSSGAD